MKTEKDTCSWFFRYEYYDGKTCTLHGLRNVKGNSFLFIGYHYKNEQKGFSLTNYLN
jgi:hypothetical protein